MILMKSQFSLAQHDCIVRAVEFDDFIDELVTVNIDVY